jgi:RimJ/RimL family protein N-acetyltransferase
MIKPITLSTNRLILRSFHLDDAQDVQRLAGDRDIAAFTLLIPHPYEDGMAEEWISTHPADLKNDRSVCFAITLRHTGSLLGAISLNLQPDDIKAEMGYWVGKPYWNKGYCTEAARTVLTYGFTVLQLNRIFAFHFVTNPASGRVLEKIGMRREGCHRQAVRKWNVFHDVHVYGILKSEFEQDCDEHEG